MNWAALDLEADELTMKLQQKNSALKMFSSQYTKLEIELVNAKQQLGDALNQIHEYETIGDQALQGMKAMHLAGQKNVSRQSHQISNGRKSEKSHGSLESRSDGSNHS